MVILAAGLAAGISRGTAADLILASTQQEGPALPTDLVLRIHAQLPGDIVGGTAVHEIRLSYGLAIYRIGDTDGRRQSIALAYVFVVVMHALVIEADNRRMPHGADIKSRLQLIIGRHRIHATVMAVGFPPDRDTIGIQAVTGVQHADMQAVAQHAQVLAEGPGFIELVFEFVADGFL